ncbi:hypothetical protein V8C35DRAFT_314498 [Trichoderma chlorosporum]
MHYSFAAMMSCCLVEFVLCIPSFHIRAMLKTHSQTNLYRIDSIPSLICLINYVARRFRNDRVGVNLRMGCRRKSSSGYNLSVLSCIVLFCFFDDY